MQTFFSEEEATITYTKKAIICSNGYIKCKEYKRSLKKVKDGYESSVKDIKSKKSKENKDHEILNHNLIRSRNLLIEYASENADQWKSFVTLTFAENVTDINKANKLFNNYITIIKRYYPDFMYLGVPEFQKRGAVHYHFLSNLRCGIEYPEREVIRTYNKEKDRYFDIKYHDLPYWSHGYSTAFDLSCTDQNFNVALYMCKYLFKDIDNRLFGRKKILKSNNLRKPTVVYLSDNEVYQGAISYIKEKGYQINEFDFNPADPFQIPFKQISTNVSHSDCNIVKNKLMVNSYTE